MKRYFAFLLTIFYVNYGYTQKLEIVEQNYEKALKLASKQDKLIFVDFYTTWCKPCKKLDQLIFKNDSISKILEKDFILLKYNAEKDKTFHLSKKHHVMSYPTAVILNKNGYLINRKYGFPGNNFETISKQVLEFTDKSIALNKQNKILKGYSNTIDISKYPKFYIDYVNRDNIKIDSTKFNAYWKKKNNVLSEEYFSTLLYFGRDVPEKNIDDAFKNRKNYLKLFGKTNADILFYFLGSSKFEKAIANNSKVAFEEATSFIKQCLDEEWASDVIKYYEKEFLSKNNK